MVPDEINQVPGYAFKIPLTTRLARSFPLASDFVFTAH